MKHRRIIGLIALVMLLACLTTIPVLAQQPCQFKGTVTLNGSPVVPANTTITAKLADGTVVMEISGDPFIYIDGGVSKYVMVIPQEDGVTLTNGTTLEFFVNGYPAGTGTWDSGEQKTVNLAAFIGNVPDISVASSLGFGSVTVGASKTMKLTINNMGTATLTISSITVSGSQFSVGTYPTTIAAGGSADVNVTFSPTSTGAKSATLTIASNDPDEASVTVSLSGTGVEIQVEDSFAWWLYETFVECL